MPKFAIIPLTAMKEIQINTTIQALPLAELNDADRALAEAAIEMTTHAYAPYSHFCVGAAIRLSNGQIVTGANQENAAYPSGTCAERSACFYAHAQYPDAKFEAIAVAARDTSGALTAVPTAPCGACRQALLEYEKLAGANVKVILCGAEDCYVLQSVRSLLPLSFSEFA